MTEMYVCGEQSHAQLTLVLVSEHASFQQGFEL